MFYDPREDLRPAPLTHNPLNAIVAPRPIGWIGSLSADGVPNLAPFSYFNAVSADPPTVVFAPNSRTDGTPKDTLANVRDTGEFTVNIVSRSLAGVMNESSKEVSPDTDEFALAGVTAVPSNLIKPCRVGESHAALECTVFEIVPLPSRPGGRSSHLVIGNVIGIHIDDDLIVDGRLDTKSLAPLARLGYFDYGAVENPFEIPRPD